MAGHQVHRDIHDCAVLGNTLQRTMLQDKLKKLAESDLGRP